MKRILPKLHSALSRCTAWPRQFIRFFYDRTIRPTSSNEDTRHTELILNVLLVGSIFLTLAADLNIFITWLLRGDSYRGVSFILFSIFTTSFIALLILSRRGYILLSAYALITIYFLMTTYGAFVWGPDLQPILIAYLLIIFISGILIDSRFGFMITALVGTIIVVFTQLQIEGVITPKLYWKEAIISLKDMSQLVTIFFIMSIVSWLSNRSTELSLHRARRSEKALQEKNESLEQIVEERTAELREAQDEKVSQLYRFAEFGRMSSGIFHDLMNPLSIIAMNVKALDDAYHPEIPTIKANVDRAVAASRRMEGFVTAIKKQISAENQLEYLDVNEKVEEAINLFNYRATKAQVAIVFNATERIHTYANTVRLHQVITNLLSNAVDACDEKNVPTERRSITINIERKNDQVVLSVIDTGCGIESSLLKKIFDPFFTTKTNFRGMGLGLSTTKHIVEKDLHGTITVESIEHKGTRFIVIFPIKHEAPIENSQT